MPDSLEEKIIKARQKVARLETEQRRVSKAITRDARKRDTRRKIIMGAILLKLCRDYEEVKQWITPFLDQEIEERDRDLFDDFL